MDIEKLIHCLQCCARVDAHNIGCDDCGLEYCGPECQQLCGTAATALSTLQAENEKLRAYLEYEREHADAYYEECGQWEAENEKLRGELEQVKAERDALKIYFDDLSSKPDCNTCAKKQCEYKPRVGQTVRANCPLWSGPEKEY